MQEPTNYEQEQLELINQARMDPDGEFARLISDANTQTGVSSGITNALRGFDVDMSVLASQFDTLVAVAPLAWNSNLATAAEDHSQVMIDNDLQTHQAPGEAGLGDRIRATGYTDYSRVAENVFAYGQNPLYDHAAFFIDWGNTSTGIQDPAGHRINIMRAEYTEIGIGVIHETNGATSVGEYVVTQNFGNRFSYSPQLVGVVFDDGDGDNFYDAGEGLAGVTVTASSSAGTFTTTSWGSGGYQMELPAGTYTVTFTGFNGDMSNGAVYKTVTIGDENAKVDANTDRDLEPLIDGGLPSATDGNDTINGTSEGELISLLAGADLTLAGGGDDTVDGGAGNDTLWGGAGNDSVSGGDGNDKMGGGEGIDTVDGGTGNDTISGAGGNDTITGGNGADKAYGDGGADHVTGGLGGDTVGGGIGNDTVYGGDGADKAWGADGDDSVWGGALGDTVDGGDGNDVIGGDGGWDKVWGNTGDDTLYGGLGNDTLGGGTGNDSMSGGDGADVFAFYTLVNGEADLIADFAVGEDHILMGGVAGASASDKFDALAISESFGSAVVSYDGHAIVLEGVAAASLTADDFMFT